MCISYRANLRIGGASLVFIELELLKALRNYDYAYIHLLSGEDLPIKSQDYIHDFFDRNNGIEYIQVIDNEWSRRTAVNRLRYYYILQEGMGSGLNKKNFIRKIIQRTLVVIQKIIKVDRLKGLSIDLYCGSQWFSITGEFAHYISQQESFIKKHFEYTIVPDEVFIQLMALRSSFRNKVFKGGNMRLLMFETGTSHPIIFQSQDYDLLKQTDCMFARKFDIAHYPEIKTIIKELLHL